MSELPKTNDKAVNLFKELITRVEEDCVVQEVRYAKVYKVVAKMKNSNSGGKNELTN